MSALLGCYLTTMSSVSPAIRCQVRVTPEGGAGTSFNPPYKLCPFDVTSPATSDILPGLIPGASDVLLTAFGIGVGTAQACQRPSAWKKVKRLTFAVEQCSIRTSRT